MPLTCDFAPDFDRVSALVTDSSAAAAAGPPTTSGLRSAGERNACQGGAFRGPRRWQRRCTPPPCVPTTAGRAQVAAVADSRGPRLSAVVLADSGCFVGGQENDVAIGVVDHGRVRAHFLGGWHPAGMAGTEQPGTPGRHPAADRRTALRHGSADGIRHDTGLGMRVPPRGERTPQRRSAGDPEGSPTYQARQGGSTCVQSPPAGDRA